MAKRNSRRDNPHHQIHYVLDRCKPTRKDIAEQLGISRQTLADWEYQRTKVRDHMLEDIQRVTGFDLSTIPAQIVQRDLDAVLNPTKKKESPRIPKANYGENVKAEADRKAKQAAKATDPKRHRIPNFGYPTAANKNPSTFSQLGPRSLALFKQEGGRDIPSDVELPDMIAVTLEPLKCYEPVFVGHHMIPHVLNRTGTINAGGDIYWKRPDGTRCVRATLDQAKAAIAQQMAQDEAATADLI